MHLMQWSKSFVRERVGDRLGRGAQARHIFSRHVAESRARLFDPGFVTLHQRGGDVELPVRRAWLPASVVSVVPVARKRLAFQIRIDDMSRRGWIAREHEKDSNESIGEQIDELDKLSVFTSFGLCQ